MVTFLDPSILIPLVALLGLFIGSFLNVVIVRLPVMMEREWQAEMAEFHAEANGGGSSDVRGERFNLIAPRSRCPHCEHAISVLENIPLVSYLFLRGRCRHCKAAISVRYPLVELLTAMLSACVAWRFGFSLMTVGALLIFVWITIALAFIDFDTRLLPDSLTLPLLWMGLIFNLLTGNVSLEDAVIGAVAGYLFLWSVYWLFKLATGKEGMGHGDFKLLAAIGAWLGWQMLPLVVVLASVTGALFGISLVALKLHRRNTPMPFGPFLAVAGLLALFQGETLNTLLPIFSTALP
ncbi:MAG: A24 family peptidase [Azoarcus sp.]|jgi:leader peptidase (prepilin peptidase)/N-methyltransferase|nr:A24 family peptidase [Azoarcus sp.]